MKRELTANSLLTFKSQKHVNRPVPAPVKPSHVFVSRGPADREHHVDQLGKYEIEKIDFNPPPPIEEIRRVLNLTPLIVAIQKTDVTRNV